MNIISRQMNDLLQNHLAQFDERHGISSPSLRVEDRIRAARLFLLMNGEIGKLVLNGLIEMPWGRIIVMPITNKDSAYLQTVKPRPALIVSSWPTKDQRFDASGLMLISSRNDFTVAAMGRPFSALLGQINRTHMNIDGAWLSARVWSSKFMMGPLVVPGVTACYECYQRRVSSNQSQPDIDRTIDQYLRNDGDFEFEGQHNTLNNLFANYVVAEVIRYFSGKPISLSQEFIMDPVANVSLSTNFIPPLEWCPVCGEKRARTVPIQNPDYTLEAVIQNAIKQEVY